MKRMLEQEEIEKLVKLLSKIEFKEDGSIKFVVKIYDKDNKEIKGV